MTIAELIAALQALDVPGETEVVIEGESSANPHCRSLETLDGEPQVRECYLNVWRETQLDRTSSPAGKRVVIWRY